MSVKYLIVIKHTNGYAGSSSCQTSITSQVLEFENSTVGHDAIECLKSYYKEYVGLNIYANKIEGAI